MIGPSFDLGGADGGAHARSDPLGHARSFSYDAVGRLTRRTEPDGAFVSFNHDPAGRLTSITDGRGYVTAFAYDSAYRLTQVTDPLGRSTVFSYDAMSRVTLGRQSQRFIGREAEVVLNPQTGQIISVNPTSSAKAARLLGGE
jgi:YD repeat-containing protein